MSDKLSLLLERATEWQSKNDDPDQRVIDAFRKALEMTTPTHAGTPWEYDEKHKFEDSGYYIPEGE